ncbi:hypothetical protein CTAYLR_006108 [Chrysophaeum taylorii]|uniref:DUF393 domain-containing protein n=1 Tax=Chrysophaeum taylorii TaxID=2483200 RepID=A0AAD7UBP7_9STRA|nr:hypothetical protein CTAYLR_006108 [Chrysophaeum taylorii]
MIGALGVAAAFGTPLVLYAASRKVASLVPKEDGEAVLFYDGVCNLCNAFVSFALQHESKVKFGAIQTNGDLMRKLGAGAFAEGGDQFLRTVVLIEGGQIYIRSDAALRVVAKFSAPWKYLAVFHVLPVGIRDAGYKKIAKWRYRIFGQTTDLRAPPPEYKDRFLNK